MHDFGTNYKVPSNWIIEILNSLKVIRLIRVIRVLKSDSYRIALLTKRFQNFFTMNL